MQAPTKNDNDEKSLIRKNQQKINTIETPQKNPLKFRVSWGEPFTQDESSEVWMDAAVVFYVVWLCWSNGTATFRRPCFCLETICHLANLGSGSSLQITSGYTGNKWKWSMSQLKTWIELSNWKPNRSTKNSKQRGVRTVSWILQVFYIGQKLELQELDHKTWQFHTISSTYPLVPMNARGKKWMSSTCRCRWGNFHGEDGAWLCKRDCKTSKTPAYYFLLYT